ncbi:MAG: alkaline phosphatase D family protein [Archangium sp.]
MKATRRQFLRVTAIGTAGFVLGCEKPAAISHEDGGVIDGEDAGFTKVDEDGGVTEPDAGATPDTPETLMEAFGFPLGIASGDVDTGRAVLWTRYDGMAPIRLRVWRMDGDVYALRVADTQVTPGDGGFVHLDVSGLEAGVRYRYAFFEEDAGGNVLARSAIGRFRAAIADGTKETLTIGACSCTHQGITPTPLARAGERTDLDVFLLLGDTSYNDGADTLSEFRTRWAANLASPEYRTMRAATSVLASWDDHEVTNDFNPETVSPQKMATAKQTFFENLPLRRDSANPDRIWKSMKWGATAEFFILDCRGERKPSTRFNGQTQIYVSREQLDWLKAGLKASTASFKVIMNSVPITDFGFSVFTGDSWISYAQQRTELLSWIDDENIGGVLWVSGDHHFASSGWVAAVDPGRTQLEVLVGPGAQSGNIAYALLRPPRWQFATDTNNYTTFKLDPMTMKVEVTFINGSGVTLFTREYDLS